MFFKKFIYFLCFFSIALTLSSSKKSGIASIVDGFEGSGVRVFRHTPSSSPVSLDSENVSVPIDSDFDDNKAYDEFRDPFLEFVYVNDPDDEFYDATEDLFDSIERERLKNLPEIKTYEEAIEYLNNNSDITILSLRFYPITKFLLKNPSAVNSIFTFIKDRPNFYSNDINNFKKYRLILSTIEDSFSLSSLALKMHVSYYRFPFDENGKGIPFIVDSRLIDKNKPIESLRFYIDKSNSYFKNITRNAYVYDDSVGGVILVSGLDDLPFDKKFAETYVLYDSKFNSESKVFFDLLFLKESFYKAKKLLQNFDAFCYYNFNFIFDKKG